MALFSLLFLNKDVFFSYILVFVLHTRAVISRFTIFKCGFSPMLNTVVCFEYNRLYVHKGTFVKGDSATLMPLGGSRTLSDTMSFTEVIPGKQDAVSLHCL